MKTTTEMGNDYKREIYQHWEGSGERQRDIRGSVTGMTVQWDGRQI